MKTELANYLNEQARIQRREHPPVKLYDRDGYATDPRFPTHANDESIAELNSLFRHTRFAGQVTSDYNYANTPESFAVTFHDLSKEQVEQLAALV